MIQVKFREPLAEDGDPWFGRWKIRVEREAQRALDAFAAGQGKAYRPRRGLWGAKKLKQHLILLFQGKCAYCEARILDVSWGDVEHYRPKKG